MRMVRVALIGFSSVALVDLEQVIVIIAKILPEESVERGGGKK